MQRLFAPATEGETENAMPHPNQTLGEMIEGLDQAMLTTLDQNGYMHSRPMMTQQREIEE